MPILNLTDTYIIIKLILMWKSQKVQCHPAVTNTQLTLGLYNIL